MDKQGAHHQYAASWNRALVGPLVSDEVLDGGIGENPSFVRARDHSQRTILYVKRATASFRIR